MAWNHIMRNAEACLNKSEEMDAIAASFEGSMAADYRSMAVAWRELAKQAAWQDSHPFRLTEN
jgi:hypothetical protein